MSSVGLVMSIVFKSALPLQNVSCLKYALSCHGDVCSLSKVFFDSIKILYFRTTVLHVLFCVLLSVQLDVSREMPEDASLAVLQHGALCRTGE